MVKSYQWKKRVMDLVFSSLGLLLSLPLWVLISICILLEDGRPVIYNQERVGKDGRIFRIFKFRSMKKNAEDESGPIWAMENDSRVTKVGRILRATALDELPQLLNILKGEMSFVGPRPERPELQRVFIERFPDFEKRLAVKPGLTGIAQVFGKYDTPPNHKLKYDLLYIRRASILLDLKLLFLSFLISLLGRWQRRERKIRRKNGLFSIDRKSLCWSIIVRNEKG